MVSRGRARRARRRNLRAMKRRDGYSVQRYGTFVSPHGTITYHEIPVDAPVKRKGKR